MGGLEDLIHQLNMPAETRCSVSEYMNENDLPNRCNALTISFTVKKGSYVDSFTTLLYPWRRSNVTSSRSSRSKNGWSESIDAKNL